MNFDTTASRFLRPPDVARLRRNQRRIQVQRLLDLAAQHRCSSRCSSSAASGPGGTRSPTTRFAVQTHRDRRRGAHAARRARSRHAALRRTESLPDRHRPRAARPRRPGVGAPHRHREEAARHAAHQDHRAHAGGAGAHRRAAAVRRRSRASAFAELSPAVGDDDLPLITDAHGAGAHAQPSRCCAMLRATRPRDLLAHLRGAADRAARLRAVRPRAAAPSSTRTPTTSPRSGATSTRCCAPRTTRRSNTRTSGSRIE